MFHSLLYLLFRFKLPRGSSNIYKIARNAINNIERPSYLCRETSNQSTSTSAYNQTLCGYEKTQL
jgi:hypothetical protein